MIFPPYILLAPKGGMSFSTSSGATYLSSVYGLILNAASSDLSDLQRLGCILLSPRNNTEAQSAPTVNDDFTLSYGVGSLWFVASSQEIYMCTAMGSTPGNASWVLAIANSFNYIIMSGIATLRANTTLYQSVYVQGYYGAGTAGGGIFNYVSTDTTSADNGGTIIVDASGRRFYRDVESNDGFSVSWFGAYGDDSHDDSTAILNAMKALPSGGGKITFPGGKFKIQTSPAFTLGTTGNGATTISVQGAGQDATILYFGNGTNGLSFTYTGELDSIHISDLTISCGIAGSGLNGLSLLRTTNLLGAFPQSDISRVTIRGDDTSGGGSAPGLDYWGMGINISGVSGVNIDAVTVYGESTGALGSGVSITGDASASPQYSVIINIDRSTFNWCLVGVLYGTYVQGVTIDQCNFTNGSTGVKIPTGAVNTAQMTISNSQINTTVNGVDIEATIADFTVANTLIFVPPAGSGIDIADGLGGTIIGNEFSLVTAGTGNAIALGSGSAFITIVGNYFNGLANGVIIASAATNIAINGNLFQGNSPADGKGIVVQSGGEAVVATGNQFNGLVNGIDVANTASVVNVQSNSYSNCTTNTVPSSSTGNVVIGGGSP